jgi:hypothetical protein
MGGTRSIRQNNLLFVEELHHEDKGAVGNYLPVDAVSRP